MSETTSTSSAPQSITSRVGKTPAFKFDRVIIIGGFLIILGALSLYNVYTSLLSDDSNTVKGEKYGRLATNSSLVVLGGWLVINPNQWGLSYTKWWLGVTVIVDVILYMILTKV